MLYGPALERAAKDYRPNRLLRFAMRPALRTVQPRRRRSGRLIEAAESADDLSELEVRLHESAREITDLRPLVPTRVQPRSGPGFIHVGRRQVAQALLLNHVSHRTGRRENATSCCPWDTKVAANSMAVFHPRPGAL
jgi:hypothetical protein